MSETEYTPTRVPEQVQPALTKSLSLLQASAFNMSNMVGIGVFLTIPFILAALPGPQALLGWLIGALLAICDGMIWCELGAALPGSGGSYLFLRETFGPRRWGRLLAFLFIWQFILSGPLEVASGSIGFAEYSKYFVPHMGSVTHGLIAAGVAFAALVLCYRRIQAVGKITVVLWVGMIITVFTVVLAGALHFNPHLAFHSGEPFRLNRAGIVALGAAMSFVIYDFLGYYVVCYVGEEVKNPQRTIPVSIILSVIVIATLYFLIHLAVTGTLTISEARSSPYVASALVERVWGVRAASVITGLILWTSFASTFALMLGYSRIPYAAAGDGCFFQVFRHVHPRGKFPDLSLLVVGLVTIAVSFIPLAAEITILLTSRILVQFIAQGFGVFLMHKRFPPKQRPFRMWLYPVPALLAIAGWIYVFATSGMTTFMMFGRAVTHSNMFWGAISLAAGIPIFFFWAWYMGFWPFEGRQPVNGRIAESAEKSFDAP
ncbi:MAG TPA: APC family permease [Candidatus Acidoferrales bacterium]|nr:APC family permease [Candidatus Acidoferrales bacterium]